MHKTSRLGPVTGLGSWTGDGTPNDEGSEKKFDVGVALPAPSRQGDTPVDRSMKGSDGEHNAGAAFAAPGFQFSYKRDKTQRLLSGADGGAALTSSSRCFGGSSSHLLEGEQPSSSDSGQKKGAEFEEFPGDVPGFVDLSGLLFPQVSPLIRSLLISVSNKIGFRRCGKTKTTGDVFPLPTSTGQLRGIGNLSEQLNLVLSCVCLGLNSYAGCDMQSDKPVSKLQKEFLEGLCEMVREVDVWPDSFGKISWGSFFQLRSLDYGRRSGHCPHHLLGEYPVCNTSRGGNGPAERSGW